MNKMLLCAEMHAVAKIANLAKIHQRVGKNSNVTLAGATSKVANWVIPEKIHTPPTDGVLF